MATLFQKTGKSSNHKRCTEGDAKFLGKKKRIRTERRTRERQTNEGKKTQEGEQFVMLLCSILFSLLRKTVPHDCRRSQERGLQKKKVLVFFEKHSFFPFLFVFCLFLFIAFLLAEQHPTENALRCN